MSYGVVWRPRDAQRLATRAFLARERGDFSDRIPKAIAEVELRLALSPATEGESRGGGERVLIVPPLTVVFEPFEDAGVVFVYEAVVYPGRRV